MLDTETRAKIDSARDILVGKVPDPKSQVEQITIALIYKFMDDMDRQSEELEGKATFFTGDFKKYRWAQLLDKRFSGHERLLLYAEGIEKMNENKNIPQLFRDIFKGVFLPYRDPETLNLFLKEINCFTYEHSERLGDAFEYLLSVLGTQGDAGQFRTPRHIIDFTVAVVDPKKTETVLDPACGTAGFLISAYKHILRGNGNLTPDERARLMSNFRGYDIAPDMVRLSRVNLYLHGFPNPVIHEYDTLTSEERWDERCDVIMANPPFMTPKGGIRPHNRFSIKAKRSEVLFVDYIAEHLNADGRAGVIVPEGIIFQSQNAYKSLRKMLVENFLWAVVSLPAGVFNPYSGVKTSILFLDKNLAKRMDEVLFVKVENDGFDLGAQRRPIEGSQIAEALEILNNHKKVQKAQEGKMELTVPRKRLLESPDINLSGDRYRVAAVRHKGKWPIVKLGEVCEVITDGISPSGRNGIEYVGLESIESDSGRLLQMSAQPAKSTKWSFKPGDVLYGKLRPNLNKVWLADRDGICSTDILVLRPNIATIASYYLALAIRAAQFNCEVLKGLGGAQLPRVKPGYLLSLEIPLPPLEEQERVVAELGGYRKVIEGARQILASYKPSIRIDPEWPIVRLGDVCLEIKSGFACGQSDKNGKGVPHLRPMNITTDGRLVWEGTKYISDEIFSQNLEFVLKAGDVLFNNTNSKELVGKTCYVNNDLQGGFSNHMTRLRCDTKKIMPQLAAVELHEMWRLGIFLNLCHKWVGQAGINNTILASIKIPLPPLDVQCKIVGELEAERKLVESNRELIARMEAKINTKLAEVWGEEASNVEQSESLSP